MHKTNAAALVKNLRTAMQAMDLPTPRTWGILVEVAMVTGLPLL